MKSLLSIRKPVVLAILLGILSLDLHPQTFADRTEITRNKKMPSSTIALRDALLKIRNHYRIDILFEEKLMEGVTTSDPLIDLTQPVEKNMTAILASTGLQYQKMKENA